MFKVKLCHTIDIEGSRTFPRGSVVYIDRNSDGNMHIVGYPVPYLRDEDWKPIFDQDLIDRILHENS